MGDIFVDDDDDEAEAQQPIQRDTQNEETPELLEPEEQISEDVPLERQKLYSDRAKQALREREAAKKNGMFMPIETFENAWSDEIIDDGSGERKDIYDAGDVIMAYYHKYNTDYLSFKAARVGRRVYSDLGYEINKKIGTPDPDFNLTEALDREKIAEEDRPFFVDCKNYKQFQNALEYLEEDRRDREIINNTSTLRGLAYGLVAGVTDPINFIPIGRALKFGTTAVKMAVEGAVIGAVNYGIRSKANNVFEVEDLALETAVSGMAAGVLTKALEAGIPLAKETYTELKNALKEAYRPNVTREFTKNAKGEVGLETTSIWGKIWEKSPDLVKKMLNNCPKFMMANNEDPLMQTLAHEFFDEKVYNWAGEGVINKSGLTAQMKLFDSKILEQSELINKLKLEYIKNGGTSEDFNHGSNEIIRNTNVKFKDLNTENPELASRKDIKPNIEFEIIEWENKASYDKNIQEAADSIIKFTSNLMKYAGEHKSIDLTKFNEGVVTKRKVITYEWYEKEKALKEYLHSSKSDIDELRKAYVEDGHGTKGEFNRIVLNIARDGPTLYNSKKWIEIQGLKDAVAIVKEAVKYVEHESNKSINITSNVVRDLTFLGKHNPVDSTYTTSLGHIFRTYDPQVINEKSGRFREHLRNMIWLNNPKIPARFVENDINTILGTVTGNKVKPSQVYGGNPAILRDREVAISDEILYQEGFAKYDAISNFAESLRQIKLDAELNRIAQESGYHSWNHLKYEYGKKATMRIGSLVGDSNTEKSQKILKDKMNYNIQLLEDVEAMFRGRFNADTSPRVKAAAGLVRAVTFLTTAGQLALSCPLDIAMLIMRHNFGHGLVSLFKDFSKGVVNGTIDVGANSLDIVHLNKAAEHIRNWKLKDKKEIEKCFGMLDSSFEKNRFAELGFEFNNDSELGKFGEKATEFVSKYTGINLITRSLKDSVAECEYSYLLKECLKENADMNYLMKMGISAEGKAKIKAAYEMRGYEKDGLSFLDLKNIGDEELSDQVHMSIQTLVDQTIMTPNIGDVPRWLRSAGGQFLCMFQTYPFLIYNNFLRHIPTGEISKGKATEVILASLALSAGYKYVKDTINGRDTDPTKAEFWKDVVDYSVLGNYIIDYATNVYNTTHLKYGEDAVSKVSPTISAINRLAKAFSGSISAEGFMNMIPGLNFWYIRPFRNYAFKKIRGD